MSHFVNLTIAAFSDQSYTTPLLDKIYIAMLNPESIKRGRSIEYTDESAVGSSAPTNKYKKSAGETLSFDLVIDCTGVVDPLRVIMAVEMELLTRTIYTYNGTIHRPNFLIVSWGLGLLFKCVLSSFDSTFTLFHPSGMPLRAKVSLSFISYVDAASLALREAKESPDITHLVNVAEGDNLPQISMQTYNSPEYYVQIAQANQLNKFRNLQPGASLMVPPLIQGDSKNG